MAKSLAIRALPWILSAVLAAIFVYAGIVKALNPSTFVGDIRAYRLLPDSVAWGVAYYLPFLEIVAGLALLLPSYRKVGAWLLFMLMTVFLFALLLSWTRGLDISCGCFGTSSAERASYSLLVLRDVFLLAALLLVGLLSSASSEGRNRV